MNDDQMPDALAEKLAVNRHYWDPEELRDIVNDLLPTVRRLIADELRAAAGDLGMAYEPTQVEEWLTRIYARADTLDRTQRPAAKESK